MVSTANCIFTYVECGIMLNNKSYLITGSNLKLFLGILNSNLSWNIFSKQEAGLGKKSFEIRKEGVENYPIPPITPSNKDIVEKIERLVKKILSAKKQNPKADTLEYEKQIDQMVYELYDLTPEEIKIVEGGI
jgi:hypothetical protein